MLATEVYNGTFKLRKDAGVRIFDYSNFTYDENGWYGYVAFLPEEVADSPEYYETWGLAAELKIPEDEWNDEYVYNPETGKIESTGNQVMSPGYVMVPGEYSIVLNTSGEIVIMERNWRP